MTRRALIRAPAMLRLLWLCESISSS
jgi:hypothetical protein